MAGSVYASSFQLAYQISPIIFSGGIAQDVPGGLLPIVLLSQAPDFLGGLLGDTDFSSLDDYLLQFRPVQGGTLIEQKIGMYPFANQSVAANAVIREPLQISLLMMIIAKPNIAGYATKAMVIQSLQSAFAAHNNSGGTYTIATPVFTYTDVVQLTVRDASRSDSKQPQNAYQCDFIQPLVTLQAALQAQAQMNSTMAQINSGTATTGAQSGSDPTVGQPPSLATSGIAPSAANLQGTAVGGAATYEPGGSNS
jgi:hypothetical protein